jgi:hypothetical protein
MTADEPAAPSTPGRSCCEKFAERISDLHDGRWPAGSGDCTKVEEHLATCPRCAELLDDYRLLTRAAEALRATQIPQDCAEVMRRRVRARIRGQVFRRRLKWTGAGLALAAAASVAVTVAMLPDRDVDADDRAPGHPAVAADDGTDDETGSETPDRIDILRNPAVVALLKELREEALRADRSDDDPPGDRMTIQEEIDLRPGDRMTIQEEIDLRREWGVFRVPGIGFPLTGDDMGGFRLPLKSRGGPLVRPGVVPVGGDGR